jgi:hypothetical protein
MAQQYEEGEFSVVQFFTEENYEYVRKYVSAVEAMRAFKHYTTSVAARMGMVERVIITDGGDCTSFEWTKGEGITYPPQYELDAALRGAQHKKVREEDAKDSTDK